MNIVRVLDATSRLKVFAPRYDLLERAFTFFHRVQSTQRLYLVALDPEQKDSSTEAAVQGLACLHPESEKGDNLMSLRYMMVHENYRNRGIATALSEAVFAFVAEQGKGLASTSYEPDGHRYLRHVLLRTAGRHPGVQFVDAV